MGRKNKLQRHVGTQPMAASGRCKYREEYGKNARRFEGSYYGSGIESEVASVRHVMQGRHHQICSRNRGVPIAPPDAPPYAVLYAVELYVNDKRR